MSDFTQALLIGGGISGTVIATQYGRHQLTRHSVVRPLLLVGGFGFAYLRGAPTGQAELWLYAVGIGLGLLFAAIATAATRVERDLTSGRVVTVCGLGFVATWVTAMAARLVFVWCADYDGAFRAHLGEFMASHQIHETAIAPFFMLWALAMVGGRLGAVLLRASQLPATPVAAPGLVAA